MPLTRDRIVRYDAARMMFRFTMLNQGESIECEISSAALDAIASEKGRVFATKEEQFLSKRIEIELLASSIFDHGTTVRGEVVRIFAKHIRR